MDYSCSGMVTARVSSSIKSWLRRFPRYVVCYPIMSDQETKAARSKRLQKARNKGIKRFNDAKLSPIKETVEYTHRFEDRSWFTCGNSNCVMCGNPRKFWSERTLKEKSDEEVTNLEFMHDWDSLDSDDSNGCSG